MWVVRCTSNALVMASTSTKLTACLVCHHPAGSAHFNSVSCLACAAFFRRTVSLDIKFICKKSNECRVFHELRMVCRACRYQRCLEAGLQPNMVQKRRIRRKDGIKIEEDLVADPKEIPSPATTGGSTVGYSPSFSSGSDALSPMDTRSSVPSLPIPPPLPLPTPTLPDALDGTNLLTHYVVELRKAMDRRYLMFSDQPITVITGYDKLPFCVGERKPHSMKRQFESQKLDHLLAFDFCAAMPGWHDMAGDEKVLFFRTATLSFCLLDIAWITCQAIEPSERLVMYTDGSVSSVDDLSFGWDDEEGLPTDEKSKIFFEFIRRLHSALILPICEIGLDEVEYAALKAFCIWKMGYVEYTQNIRSLAKKQETALLLGLDAHYEDREDKAERMGNLILLMGTIFELYQNVLEMYQGITLFDLLNVDLVSKELLAL